MKPATRLTTTIMQRFVLLCIKAYQLLLAPLLGGQCRYYPSCSVYARKAVELHGPLSGLRLAAGRILRCNPFSDGGLDPVPGDTSIRPLLDEDPDKNTQQACHCLPTSD